MRPTRGLSSAILWLFGASAVLTVAERPVRWWFLDLFRRDLSGEASSSTEFSAWGIANLAVGALVFFLWLASVVVFLIWLWRAHANLRDAGFPLRYGPNWAVAWWFVPIANLIEPYRVMADFWRATEPSADNQHWRKVFVPTFIIYWWVLRILSWPVRSFAYDLLGD